MPFLYHGNNKLWSRISLAIACCQRKLSRYSKKKEKKEIISPDLYTPTITTTDTTTRDWRSLSPNDPPLPFVIHDTFGPINSINISSQSSEQIPKRLSNNYRKSPDEGNLSTIIEESDMRTEISPSPRSSTGHYWSFYQHQEETNHTLPTPSPPSPPLLLTSSTSTSTSVPVSPKYDTIKDTTNTLSISSPPIPKASSSTSSRTSSLSSSSSSSSSSSTSINSFQPPPAWPIHPKTERRWSSSSSPLPTNEKNAKRKFTKMIQAAYRFRQEHIYDIPSEMELLFDSNDNINQLRLWIHGKIQYHSFEGDAQYIPPEISSRCIYRCDRVDVWVLGISLYRMLVGRYPFHANDDRRLLKKMQQADFGIPSNLSTDAKDLLRRMLAPDQSRASLDLVIFHPWLKPYTVQLSPSIINATLTTAATTTTPIFPSPRVVPDDLDPPLKPSGDEIRQKRKSMLAFRFTKAMVFIVDGPYPPPKQPYRALISP